MWTCTVCSHEIEPEESFCYHCGADRTITAAQVERLLEKKVEAARLRCLRCDTEMKYAGEKTFHEGKTAWGFWLGDVGELLTDRERYDTYVCTRCGKVEFFLDGIGEEYRIEET